MLPRQRALFKYMAVNYKLFGVPVAVVHFYYQCIGKPQPAEQGRSETISGDVFFQFHN
jgi:hypothetical protein